jgi:hypothetical protein
LRTQFIIITIQLCSSPISGQLTITDLVVGGDAWRLGSIPINIEAVAHLPCHYSIRNGEKQKPDLSESLVSIQPLSSSGSVIGDDPINSTPKAAVMIHNGAMFMDTTPANTRTARMTEIQNTALDGLDSFILSSSDLICSLKYIRDGFPP